MGEPARILLRRRVDWFDTDASTVYHWTTALRFMEAAEAALHDRLGISEQTFGRTPRVHVEADFRREVRFYDLVDVDFRVESVGNSSVRYAFELRHDGVTAAAGQVVAVFVSQQPFGAPTPWPDDLRAALAEGGDQGVAGETP